MKRIPFVYVVFLCSTVLRSVAAQQSTTTEHVTAVYHQYVPAEQYVPPARQPASTATHVNTLYAHAHLTQLMAQADLIVEAVCVGWAASAVPLPCETTNVPYGSYQSLRHMRVQRVIASGWDETQTRERLIHRNNNFYLYVTERFHGDGPGVINDPLLYTNGVYLLWLQSAIATDADLAWLRPCGSAPLSEDRRTMYRVCHGDAGSVRLDPHAILVWFPPAYTAEERLEYQRRAEQNRSERLQRTFGTTNVANIAKAVEYLSRAMTSTAPQDSTVNAAALLLALPDSSELKALLKTRRFSVADWLLQSH